MLQLSEFLLGLAARLEQRADDPSAIAALAAQMRRLVAEAEARRKEVTA